MQKECALVALATIIDGKPSVIVATTEDARASGLKAGVFAKTAAGVLGGGGGGRDDMAQCGGTDATKVDEALKAIAAELSK
jgi:alanyl-tRNA synthetase